MTDANTPLDELGPVDYVIVAGSSTDELTGIQGTAQSVSTHDDYPNMPLTLEYSFQ